MKLIKNTISKLNGLLKGLSKNQRILLGVAIGYFLYVTYVKVENFFQDEEDAEEDTEEEDTEEENKTLNVQEKVIQRSVWDNLAGNLGVKTPTLQLEDRQHRAKKDEFSRYQGDNKEVRQALAQADDFNKYQ